VRILADTHVLLWWLSDDPALPAAVRRAVADSQNDVLISAVRVAEISIKASLGKLEAPDDLVETLAAEGFGTLAFTVQHAATLRHLPWHHRDPFDRMLVAQALVDSLVLATVDRRLSDYGVPLI
jgi:PIN domain nuclease of toxin-antitoxin system